MLSYGSVQTRMSYEPLTHSLTQVTFFVWPKCGQDSGYLYYIPDSFAGGTTSGKKDSVVCCDMCIYLCF